MKIFELLALIYKRTTINKIIFKELATQSDKNWFKFMEDIRLRESAIHANLKSICMLSSN